MRSVISKNTAAMALRTGPGLLLVFHLLVLVGIIPSRVVWGGQTAEGHLDPTIMELVAAAVTILFGLIVGLRSGYILPGRWRRIGRIGIWLVAMYFLLNTIGNLTSGVLLESCFFGPYSLLLSLLAIRLTLTD